MCAPRSLFALGHDITVLDLDRRAEFSQTHEVQVDRPCADGAAAGQRHARPAHARHERAEHEHRCAHGPHEIVGRFGVREYGGVDQDIIVLPLKRHPHVLEDPSECRHVGQARDIRYPMLSFAQKRCRKDRQSARSWPR